MLTPLTIAGRIRASFSLSRDYSPVLCAFITSLLLSLIALYFHPILGRDSALYIDVASTFVLEGFANPTSRFDWPWLPLIIALVHKVTGLSVTGSGYLLMAGLMAGTCALITRATQLFNPAAAWWGCLVSVSLPAFNAYRDAILREPGFWMFSALSLVTVGLWAKTPYHRWPYLMASVSAIVLAMMFRLEATFLFGALGLVVVHQYASLIQRYKYYCLSAIFFILVSSAALGYFVAHHLSESVRIDYYISLLNPSVVANRLDSSAALLREHILGKYSHNDAARILLFGFFGTLLFNTVKLLGPFVIPVALSVKKPASTSLNRMGFYMLSALGLYLCVLMVFFIQLSFMIDRYLALLHIVAAPLIALSAWRFEDRFPKSGKILAAVAILVALSNVVSFSDKRTHYIPAGKWIEEHVPADGSVYYTDGRISFYANRRYVSPTISDEEALTMHFDRFDYFVLEPDQVNAALAFRLETGELEMLADFSNGKRHHLVIAAKKN